MSRIGLAKTENVAKLLNGYLANLHVLYTKFHNFHWNIEGKEFFTLHAKLEELYDGVASEIDEVAERILMLGHRPAASMADYLKAATLKEVPGEGIDGKSVVTSVLADYEVLIRDLRAAIKEAQDNEDEVSADLLIGLLAKYEKNVWMLEAYLK